MLNHVSKRGPWISQEHESLSLKYNMPLTRLSQSRSQSMTLPHQPSWCRANCNDLSNAIRQTMNWNKSETLSTYFLENNAFQNVVCNMSAIFASQVYVNLWIIHDPLLYTFNQRSQRCVYAYHIFVNTLIKYMTESCEFNQPRIGLCKCDIYLQNSPRDHSSSVVEALRHL